MNTVDTFKSELMNWLRECGFNDVKNLDFAIDFAYNIPDHKIHIGVQRYPEVSEWFVEFLDEYGFMFEDVPEPVLCFLHELGHNQTIYNFSDETLQFLAFRKNFTLSEGKEGMMAYWTLDDELAANKWLIDWTSNHIDEFFALCSIYSTCWNAMVDEVNVFDLIQEVIQYVLYRRYYSL